MKKWFGTATWPVDTPVYTGEQVEVAGSLHRGRRLCAAIERAFPQSPGRLVEIRLTRPNP